MGNLARNEALGVAAACALGNVFGLSTIIFYTFSIFLVPVATELGWPRADLSFALTIISVVGIFSYPLGGVLMDVVGARPTILIGNILFGLSVMALATIGSNHGYAYTVFALIGATAALQSTVLLTRVVSAWFDRSRGRILSITSGLAFGVGGVVTPMIAQVVSTYFGWRSAYVVLGAIPIVISAPIMFRFLKEGPSPIESTTQARLSHLPEDTPSIGRQNGVWIFILLLLSAALGAGAVNAVSSHISVFLSANGLGGTFIVLTIAGLSMATAIWQILLGVILDKGRSPRIAGIFLLAAAVGAAIIFEAHDRTQVFLGAVLMGVGSGTEFGLLPFCLSRYFGLRHYGLIYGFTFGLVSLVIGSSPFVVDLFYDHYASYTISIYALVSLLILSGVLLFFLPHYDEYRQGSVNAP